MQAMQNIDIDVGVDFEIARGILNDDASNAFRTYDAAKKNPQISQTDLARHRLAYVVAKDAFRGLRPTDKEVIQQLVGGADYGR